MKKQILTLTVIIVAFSQALAQAPDTTWTKTLGGSSRDDAWSINQTSPKRQSSGELIKILTQPLKS
jgi:hypothetical protein